MAGLSARAALGGRGRAILIVDDEQSNVDLLTAVLRDSDYRPLGAADGRQALARLETSTPDLLLLDLQMPIMDGAQTLRAIRGDARFASLPIIIMSGLAAEVVERRCHGHDAFLHKPFSLQLLLSTLERLLRTVDRPRERRRSRG